MRAASVRLDPKDLDGLRVFFRDHAHLSTNDQAQIADVSSKTIRTYRRLLGIKLQDTTARPPGSKRLAATPTAQVPPDWRRDRDWLVRMLNVYNVETIAKMVERNKGVVYNALRKHKIPTKGRESQRSKNKCCTHSWCHHHYVTLGLSQTKCARLAGIRQQTFSIWLNKFKIVVRDGEQTHNGRTHITLWEKDLIARLRQQDTVRRVYVREGYIHVRYKNYFWENYYTRAVRRPKRPYTYFEITETNSKIKRVPQVYPEFGSDVSGKALYPAHIALSRADLKTASMVERRVALHEFARQVVTRGWVTPTFPDHVLREDMGRLVAFDPKKFMESGGYTTIYRQGIPPGRRVMMNFFDFSPLWPIVRKPIVTVKVCNALLAKTVKFNFFNFLMAAAGGEGQKGGGLSIPDAAVYLSIFRNMKFSGTMMDISVGMGNRAVAAAGAGLRYTTPDPAFDHAIRAGFLDFSGLDYEPYSGQKVDFAIYDEGFGSPDMAKVLPYLDRAKKLLVFCPAKDVAEVQKYNPATSIRLRTRLYDRTPGSLMIW